MSYATTTTLSAHVTCSLPSAGRRGPHLRLRNQALYCSPRRSPTASAHHKTSEERHQERESTRSIAAESGPIAGFKEELHVPSPDVAELRRMYLDTVKRASVTACTARDREIPTEFEVPDFVEAVRQAHAEGTIDLRDPTSVPDWGGAGRSSVRRWSARPVSTTCRCRRDGDRRGRSGRSDRNRRLAGGVTILMRGVLAAYGIDDRRVSWPTRSVGFRHRTPRPIRPTTATSTTPRISSRFPANDVETNFRMYGLLDEQVQFLEGWFSDTLPTVAATAAGP